MERPFVITNSHEDSEDQYIFPIKSPSRHGFSVPSGALYFQDEQVVYGEEGVEL